VVPAQNGSKNSFARGISNACDRIGVSVLRTWPDRKRDAKVDIPIYRAESAFDYDELWQAAGVLF
jgi:hypothetical protein